MSLIILASWFLGAALVRVVLEIGREAWGGLASDEADRVALGWPVLLVILITIGPMSLIGLATRRIIRAKRGSS